MKADFVFLPHCLVKCQSQINSKVTQFFSRRLLGYIVGADPSSSLYPMGYPGLLRKRIPISLLLLRMSHELNS